METFYFSFLLAFMPVSDYFETGKAVDLYHEHNVCGYIKKTENR